MNRKWQREALQNFSTVEPIHSFVERLPPLPDNLEVASVGDVYSAYSQLHSKGRKPQLHVNQSGGFYYFLAEAPQEAETGNLVGWRRCCWPAADAPPCAAAVR
jgi:hypothetical protein